jgi:hypothetical protein
MVRMNMEAAEQLLKGKSPREIYDIVRAQVEKAPNAKFQDLFETLDWVVQNGFATAEELDAVEEENS